jgi:hypothetical protein
VKGIIIARGSIPPAGGYLQHSAGAATSCQRLSLAWALNLYCSEAVRRGGIDMKRLLGALVALTLLAGSPLVAAAGAAEDTMITTKVKTKLTTDRVKNLVSVNVDTKDGVVHLKGTVPNEQAKAEAERLAKGTDGVVSVTNDIKVSPPK